MIARRATRATTKTTLKAQYQDWDRMSRWYSASKMMVLLKRNHHFHSPCIPKGHQHAVKTIETFDIQFWPIAIYSCQPEVPPKCPRNDDQCHLECNWQRHMASQMMVLLKRNQHFHLEPLFRSKTNQESVDAYQTCTCPKCATLSSEIVLDGPPKMRARKNSEIVRR